MRSRDPALLSAQHEAAHALIAHGFGFYVDSVRISPGRTVVVFGYAPLALWTHLLRDKWGAIKLLSEIAAVSLAGAIADGLPPSARDLEVLDKWGAQYPDTLLPTWEDIVESGEAKARRYLSSDEGMYLHEALVQELLAQGELKSRAFTRTLANLTRQEVM